MSRLLERSSAILSLLGSDPGHGFTVGEVAAACGLPPATCTRLLRELVRLGWADQRGVRRPYRLGPRAYALTTAQPYRHRLVRAAFPVARDLADQLGERVVVAVLRGSVRQVLFECDPSGELPERRYHESDDLYRSGGGRLLFALLPAQRRRRLVDTIGLPDPRHWPGVLTRSELTAECRRIRRAGWLHLRHRDRPMASVVAACRDGEGGHAAIGIHAPVTWWTAGAEAAVRAAAAAIDRALA